MKETLGTIAAVLFALAILLLLYASMKDCEASGGVYVRTAFGHECLKR